MFEEQEKENKEKKKKKKRPCPNEISCRLNIVVARINK